MYRIPLVQLPQPSRGFEPSFEEVQVRVRRAGDENKEEVGGAVVGEKFDRVGSLKKEQDNGNKWVFPKIGVPQNGWFIMEIPIKMDDLGGKPTIFGNTQI